MDLIGQRKSRLGNSEYLSFIKESLEAIGISGISPRDELAVIELGCGAGPLSAHLLEQGYNAEFSDYSETLVRRLRDKSGYQAFAGDCSDLSNIQNESYDVVILAGTVYESTDYFFACRIYGEINRMLKKGGVFIHFLNAHNTPFYRFEQSLAGRILGVPASIVGALFNPIESIKSNNLVRFLWRRPMINSPSIWLYHHSEIRNMLTTNHFDIRKLTFMQLESGVCANLPFLARKARKNTIGRTIIPTCCSRKEMTYCQVGNLLGRLFSRQMACLGQINRELSGQILMFRGQASKLLRQYSKGIGLIIR